MSRTFFNCLGLVFLCQLFSFASFTQCEDFEIESGFGVSPDCYGDATGWISVETIGGTGENTYSILPDEFSIDAEGIAEDLPAGEYTIGIIDEVGCELEFPVTISEPDELRINDEFGFSPAYCRTAGDQNGGGVVYGAASGGTGTINYEWTYLETGETTTNTTWGGRNPGEYQLKVTDDNGCELITYLTLDSINPKADFDIISDDVWDIPYGYAGNAPVNIVCKNTSLAVDNYSDPDGAGTYRWHMHNYADWITTDDIDYEPSITYNFENLWGIKLAVESANGCLDTAHQFIAVFGPVSLEELDEIQAVSLVPNEMDGTIKIQKSGFSNGIQVRLYNASGELIFENSVINNEESFPFNMVKGVYLYEFINSENSERIGSGKFVY